ncbi:MAG TPA: hypothetical protein VER14_00380 [Phototrophicaceae bacterium]|nr:hypothetical protein [Phototrophicaceae bacterium]
MVLCRLFKDTTTKKEIEENEKFKKLIVIIFVIEPKISYSQTIHDKYGSAILGLWEPLQISLDNGSD